MSTDELRAQTTAPKFDGHENRECGDHHSTGRRAWCFACSEWCYPRIPCRGCELPALRAELDERKAAADRIRQIHRISPLGDHCEADLHTMPCPTIRALGGGSW